MNNFEFFNPTRIVFGKDTIKKIDKYIDKNNRVLITYGGGSIKRNGVYDQVIAALGDRKVFEFGGIEPNPHYETCMKCVDYIKENNIDFILAVGGGSVIDATKFISAAYYFEGYAWDIIASNKKIERAIPFGTVLTLPATGSEMNSGSVITLNETKVKKSFHSELCFPIFSILDPILTLTLPKKQISNGIADTFIHVIEQYLTYPVNNQISDRFAESILITLIEESKKVFSNPEDYDVRANIMWSATLGLNGLIGCGVPQDWATHMIGHELTVLHGLDHGITLAIVLPGVMKIMKDEKGDKILQMGERVFGIKDGEREERILKTIEETENFFISIGIPTRLSDHGLDENCIDPIVQRMIDRKWSLGENGTINPEKVRLILLDRL
ncbi:MAG: iron-containing alcohol dehydrogenase [Bacteroidales bacterium]